MLTEFGEKLDRTLPLPEHPRPQMQRENWLNLNGEWDYAITGTTVEEQPPAQWDGKILVPFSPEAPLSGVNRTLDEEHTLWYSRALPLPDGWDAESQRYLLHFDAVDQEAYVYVNGKQAGYHMGGYTAFCVDVTEYLLPEGNTLVVRVHDDTDHSWHSRGKQSSKRGGIWYTPQSGIWQTVWMEAVPSEYITGLSMTPDIDKAVLKITVSAKGGGECKILCDGEEHTIAVNVPAELPVKAMHLWSPEDPHLYPVEILYGQDKVKTYFAMRKTEVRTDGKGVKRLFLNNKPCFHNGLLDQGYWPDGLYTPPSDEAMEFDIATMKKLGFNMLRKHIKVEPMRWYYHCDRLGMLVWQDMVNGGGIYKFSVISVPLVSGIHMRDKHYRAFAREAEQGRREYMNELKEMICQLKNVPSIVLWVPFNEGWGQFDAADACQLIDKLDGSRPIDHASGWHDQKIGDIQSLHVYFRPYQFKKDRKNRAVVLSEFGGYNLPVEGHTWNDANFGYKGFKTGEEFWQAYEKLFEEQILPAVPKGLAATVYTQVTDVEDEVNGLMTYDRRVVKVHADKIRNLNEKLIAMGNEE